MITKKIKLKTWETNYAVLYANQGEINSRFIEITFDTQNQNLDLTNKTVTIYAAKPDGNLIYNNCAISDASSETIVVELTSQMSEIPGAVICELHIFDENGCLLKIKGLQIMIISCDDFSSAIQSTSEYNTLINCINEVEDLINQYSDENILQKISSLAGTGSGLNADMIDGKHSDDFATAAQGLKADMSIQQIKVNGETIPPSDSNSDINVVEISSSQLSVPAITSGTWTPVLQSLSGTHPTYTTEYCHTSWYRIENLVFIHFHMKCNITNAGTDYACVNGLPFTAKNGLDGQALCTRESCGAITTTQGTTGIIEDNTTKLRIANISGDTKQQWGTGAVWLGYTGCYIKE
ncbi:MAG: phage baseplate upper protein [Oscillospiraceae bacterium]|jgi:hypothetical protein|nr:phage baseplate upper protein [Oscillospiraceae bacterium]